MRQYTDHHDVGAGAELRRRYSGLTIAEFRGYWLHKLRSELHDAFTPNGASDRFQASAAAREGQITAFRTEPPATSRAAFG